MADYKSEFLRGMDRQGLKYQDMNDNIVRVTFSGDNLRTIPIIVVFNDDGEHLVQFACFEIAAFKENRRYAAALMACNRINAKYRWVKFYLDDDRDVRAEADAVVESGCTGSICIEIVMRMVQVIDEAYNEFKRI